jgi:hypothetical protein
VGPAGRIRTAALGLSSCGDLLSSALQSCIRWAKIRDSKVNKLKNERRTGLVFAAALY